MNNLYLGRLVKVFWMFSLLVFLAVLLYVYVQLPPFISFTSEFSALSFLNFDKSNLFYWSLAIFVLSNLTWYLISKVLQMRYQKISNKETGFFTPSRIASLTTWFNSFSSIINILIIFSLVFINILFSEEKSGLNVIGNIIYGFLAIAGVWFLLLVYVIVKKENSEFELEA